MKLQSDTIQELTQLASEVAERSGLSLYDIEFIGSGKHRTLRVYIDREAGVSIDDCADFSRGYSVLLDASDIIPGGGYELEVSSPGLERRLTQPWHFEKVIGKKIQVKTKEPVNLEVQTKSGDAKSLQARNLVGELFEFKDSTIEILKDKQNWKVELENIEKAQVVFEAPEKGKKNNKKNNKRK